MRNWTKVIASITANLKNNRYSSSIANQETVKYLKLMIKQNIGKRNRAKR